MLPHFSCGTLYFCNIDAPLLMGLPLDKPVGIWNYQKNLFHIEPKEHSAAPHPLESQLFPLVAYTAAVHHSWVQLCSH